MNITTNSIVLAGLQVCVLKHAQLQWITNRSRLLPWTAPLSQSLSLTAFSTRLAHVDTAVCQISYYKRSLTKGFTDQQPQRSTVEHKQVVDCYSVELCSTQALMPFWPTYLDSCGYGKYCPR